MISPRKTLKFLGIILAILLGLILLPILALYLPPVQRWAVERVSSSLEESMGVKVKVDEVRLTPFLNLDVQGMIAQDRENDTLLATDHLHLDVAFWPLLDGRADVEGFGLKGARINSKTLIPDVGVKGRIQSFSAEAKGVDWKQSIFTLNKIQPPSLWFGWLICKMFIYSGAG